MSSSRRSALRGARFYPCFALVAVASAMAGCRSSSTGVHVHVSFDGIVTQQLEFSVLAQDRTPILQPTLRPDPAQGELGSPQDVVIYLPDVAQSVICRVVARSTPPAAAETQVAISVHQIADVSLALAPASPDGGTDGPPRDGPADRAADGDAHDAPSGGEVRDAGVEVLADTGASDLPVTDRENGQVCSTGTECASTFCVDGVCCSSACTGTCRSCNIKGSVGSCTTVPAGQPPARNECTSTPVAMCGNDGTCDGKGACRKYPIGTECRAATCAAGGDAVMAPSRCDGKGVCVASTNTTTCDPYVCDGPNAKCFAACTADAQCTPPHTCVGGKCGKKPNGDACGGNSECNSGFCTDGVCCNLACSGACVACDVSGALGLCTALPAGALDQHKVCTDEGVGTCGNNGLCNGAGACQKYAAGLVCVPTQCTDATLASSRTCDGNGTCLPPSSTMSCGTYACNTSSNQCLTTCTKNTECVAPATCKGGHCR